MNREVASDRIEIDPALTTLAGHDGDGRALLQYFFAIQCAFVQPSRIYADACERLYQSVEFVPDYMIEKFVSTMTGEPFAKRILTQLLCDQHAMVQLADAAAFLENFLLKFPG